MYPEDEKNIYGLLDRLGVCCQRFTPLLGDG